VSVLLSSLPELPGRPFDVRGFVFAQAALGALGGGNTGKMVLSLIEQAQRFDADAIVDLRTVLGGDSAYCVMTGTAVRLMPQ
jgi:hypothetical protein